MPLTVRGRDEEPFEQPGCLHANMDLYKWAFKLAPFAPAELVADCFALARDIRNQIQKVFAGKVFNTVITKSVRLEESPAYKESIFTFAPESSGASDYYSLCEEVIERVEARPA